MPGAGMQNRRELRSLVRLIAVALSLATTAQAQEPAQPPPAVVRFPADGRIDFKQHVQPIFAASCVECHGEKKRKGQLRLDIKAAALKGGKTGALFIAGNSEESHLIERVMGLGDEQRMPLDRDPLPEESIRILRAWVDQGASWPDDGLGLEHGAEEKHWAYVAPVRPRLPDVRQSAWVRNEIDRFVLARLEGMGLTPSLEAARETLIRRVTLDLTGLPPEPDEVAAFLGDSRTDAYERLVDRLLASPHYGERWARTWLDVARYADSHGYEKDGGRSVWPYRDWVIEALNADMPFDRFTIEQLAGDLLPNPTRSQLIATGFHRNSMINEEGGTDPEEYRVNAVMDRVNTTATVWLGSTLACAQCHDHKFDPFTQKDYYRFFAFYNSTAAESQFAVGSSFQEISAKVELPDPEFAARRRQANALTSFVRTVGDKAPEYGRAKKQVDDLRDGLPSPPTALIMKELDTPRESRILQRGSFLSPGEVVEPGVPHSLGELAAEEKADRAALARWLVSERNPLTARVAANRIWEQHFGRGIVETSEDFGTRGSPPSDQALLDWLAMELVAKKWSQKAMHRLIVTSAAYRQESRITPELLEADPVNARLARGPRFRLDAEMIRDQALAIGGLLSRRMGGPPVFPVQPEGIWSAPYSDNRYVPSTGEDRYRRSIYTYWKRSSPYPSFVSFDAPNRQVTCTRRPRTNTPLQALTTLNDPVYVEAAVGLAKRMMTGAASATERVDLGMKLCLARAPAAEERERLLALFEEQLSAYRAEPDRARDLVSEVEGRDDAAELAAWTVVANVMLNLDELLNNG